MVNFYLLPHYSLEWFRFHAYDNKEEKIFYQADTIRSKYSNSEIQTYELVKDSRVIGYLICKFCDIIEDDSNDEYIELMKELEMDYVLDGYIVVQLEEYQYIEEKNLLTNIEYINQTINSKYFDEYGIENDENDDVNGNIEICIPGKICYECENLPYCSYQLEEAMWNKAVGDDFLESYNLFNPGH